MNIKKKKINGRIFRSIGVVLAVGIILILSEGCRQQSFSQNAWNQLPAVLERIQPPVFSPNEFNIKDFGAVGNGEFDCSSAFENVIDACYRAGGGRIVVDDGIFLTGAITLKSNIELHITETATILFSKDVNKFLPVVYTRFEGTECMNFSPFIYAYEQENIAITGRGTLDGQAGTDAWWPWVGVAELGWEAGSPTAHKDSQLLQKMAEKGVPVNERIFGKGHQLRPNFIQPYECRNVLIQGITIKRSPMWVIHPVLCENVSVKDVIVISHGPNNDGCDPECSKNVLIKNCIFDTGDDCIAIKSGRNNDGRRVNVASENIVVQSCVMKDGHGGVVIGSEISGNCRNVFIEDCLMDSPSLERAIRIKSNTLRGGIVENVYVRNIIVGEVNDAVIRIFMHYANEVGDHSPVVRNIFLENIRSKKSRYALLFDGHENLPIENIYIENCQFNKVKETNILNHVNNLVLKNVYIDGRKIHIKK